MAALEERIEVELWQPAFWRQHPGFASLSPVAERVCNWSEWPPAPAYYDALSAGEPDTLPVRFVGAEPRAYEDHIADTGEVPTRYGCWHDLLNALIWHCYPRAKVALNRLHRAAKVVVGGEGVIGDPFVGNHGAGHRGRRRDAATLFDENGAVIWSADAQLLELIRRMDWPTLFLQHRHAFGTRLHIALFGHGLLEKMRQPYVGLTAHAMLLHTQKADTPQSDSSLTALDVDALNS